jgi:hypothetical protein
MTRMRMTVNVLELKRIFIRVCDNTIKERGKEIS